MNTVLHGIPTITYLQQMQLCFWIDLVLAWVAKSNGNNNVKTLKLILKKLRRLILISNNTPFSYFQGFMQTVIGLHSCMCLTKHFVLYVVTRLFMVDFSDRVKPLDRLTRAIEFLKACASLSVFNAMHKTDLLQD